jgi:cytidylate kinase
MKRILIIEREFGCGGGVIAAKAAQRLSWQLFDRALTQEIARLAKVPPEVCQRREERVDSGLYRLAKAFWHGSHERGLQSPGSEVFDTDRFVQLAQHVVEQAAAAGQCVIVGRGAPHFLRQRTDTFCVFLYAPREFKIQNVRARVKSEPEAIELVAPRELKIQRVRGRIKTEAEAIELVDTVDRHRMEFVKHYFGTEWPRRHLYHAMLNTALGEDATVDAILYLLEAANRREAAVTS